MCYILSCILQRVAQGGGVAVRTPYLRVVGLEPEEDGAGRTIALFSPEEEEEFRVMARYACRLLTCRCGRSCRRWAHECCRQ